MKSLSKLWAAGALVAALFLVIADRHGLGLSQEPAILAQDGIQVQTRGPIHEAFLQPDVLDQEAPAPIVPKKPPEPVNELPSEDRPQGDQYQWIPGNWAWDDDRGDFLWVSGIWRVPPAGRQWAPGYWLQADGGWRWVSGFWAPVAETTMVLLPPPPEQIEEAVPAPPDQDSFFLPGIWVYQPDRNQYWWRPGHWVRQRPGWIWTPARFHWTPGGYLFVNGFWDLDMANRGIAFAPVYLDRRWIERRDWYYRPAYALAADTLLNSLFVRTGGNQYWFGDYYDPAYARRGYRPWVEGRYANVHDPLYSYYRWRHQEQPRWEQDLRSVYTTRRDNVAERPARTLAEQNKAGANAAARVVVPLREARHPVKVEPLPKARAEEIRKASEEWRRLSQARAQLESNARTAPAGVTSPAVKVPPAPVPPVKPPPDKPPPVKTPPVKTPPVAAPPVVAPPAAAPPARFEMPKTSIVPPRIVSTPPPPPAHPAAAPRPAPPRKESKDGKEKDKK